MKMNKQVLSLGLIALLVITSTSSFAATGKEKTVLANLQEATTIQSEIPVSTTDAVIYASTAMPAISLESSEAFISAEGVTDLGHGDAPEMAIESMMIATNLPASDLSQISEAVQINISEQLSAVVESTEITATATIAATILEQSDVTVERK